MVSSTSLQFAIGYNGDNYTGYRIYENEKFRIGTGSYCLALHSYAADRSAFKAEFIPSSDFTETEWNDSFDSAQVIDVNTLYYGDTLSNYENLI